jgi:hypothetical protein
LLQPINGFSGKLLSREILNLEVIYLYIFELFGHVDFGDEAAHLRIANF